eukprot:6586596-Prymnesium_polylepis.1
MALVQSVVVCCPPPPVWLLTSGTQVACANAAHGSMSGAAHGGVWGVGRVVRLELAALKAHCVDIAHEAGVAGALVALTEIGEETEVVNVGGCRCVSRLHPCGWTAGNRPVIQGRYAITSGFGGLGLRAAALLVEMGAACVQLAALGSSMVREGQALVAQVVTCDSADPSDVCAFVGFGQPVDGVFHAAGGAADDATVGGSDAQRAQRMCARKAHGARYLHSATVTQPLSAFVLCSSVASALGGVGVGSYAASNAWLDAHAHARRTRGALARSLQWP